MSSDSGQGNRVSSLCQCQTDKRCPCGVWFPVRDTQLSEYFYPDTITEIVIVDCTTFRTGEHKVVWFSINGAVGQQQSPKPLTQGNGSISVGFSGSANAIRHNLPNPDTRTILSNRTPPKSSRFTESQASTE
jgi:hypothetical protein